MKNLKKFFTPLNTLILVLSLFLIFLVIFFAQFLTNINKTATIRILVAPINSTVEINDTIYPTDTTIKIEPGTYNVKISAPDFETFTGTIEARDHETSYLYEFLSNTSAEDYYNIHPEDAARAQTISDFLVELEQKAYLGTDPIFSITPYSSYSAGFEIYSSREPFAGQAAALNTYPYLKIYLITCKDEEVESLKSAAQKYLTNHNINLDNYNITYRQC